MPPQADTAVTVPAYRKQNVEPVRPPQSSRLDRLVTYATIAVSSLALPHSAAQHDS